MTTLVCDDLYTYLEQNVRFLSPQRIHIAGIYPYLLKMGNPSGTFTFSLKKGSVTIFSNSFIASDISSSNYIHTFFPIIPTNPVQIEIGLYTLRLSASGYAYASNSCISWVQQFENIQNEMEYVPTYPGANSLSTRIKTYSEGIK